jgi:hypothetical protein
MDDEQIARKMNSGSAMTTWGIVLLIVTFLGTCAVSMSQSGKGDPMAQGFENGKSPFLALGIGGAITLIAVGQARKSNARRALEERIRLSNTSVELVPDPEVPGGPFRGGHREVEKLDPAFEAADADEKARNRSRGNGYLIAGFLIMGLSVAGMLWGMQSDPGESPRKQMEDVFLSLGLAFFPFGLGLFFAIKGALLRSK